MDATDKKLLSQLVVNSRLLPDTTGQALRHLSRSGNLPPRTTSREGNTPFIHHENQPHTTRIPRCSLLCRNRSKKEAAFVAFLETCPFISWVGKWTGKWSYGMSIVGKSQEEIDTRFLEIKKRFGASIIQHSFTFHKRTRFFYEKYLGVTPAREKKSNRVRIDKHDMDILRLLATNARIEYAELAKEIPLSAPAIATRIKRLETAGVIEQYTLFLNQRALNIQQYSIFVDRSSANQELLRKQLDAHPNVSYTASYIGEPYFEFGIFVKDPYHVRPLLREICSRHEGLKVLDTFFYEDAIQSVGPPSCVFDYSLYG
jgi:DNA-binding Lrp family transcriptional regulator